MEATSDILCTRPRPIHACSATEEEENEYIQDFLVFVFYQATT